LTAIERNAVVGVNLALDGLKDLGTQLPPTLIELSTRSPSSTSTCASPRELNAAHALDRAPDPAPARKTERSRRRRAHAMSRISIIGTGNMARALGSRALAGGNAVEVLGRDASKADALATVIGGATAGTIGAAPAGDIVILAVPYAHAAPVLRQFGNALSGKVIVDITNPFNPDLTGLVTPEGSSAAQEIAKRAPTGAHVVKAFNTVFGHVLAAYTPEDPRPLDVFIAGDDAEAKARVSLFVESLALRPLDVGDLKSARWLEGTSVLLMRAMFGKAVHSSSFSIGLTVRD
jgi:predicted dinucleotide-binding enzyme